MLKGLWAGRSYRYRTIIMLIGSMIPLWAIVLFYVLPLVRQSMYEDRQIAVRSTVDVASTLISHYYSLYEKNQLSEEEA